MIKRITTKSQLCRNIRSFWCNKFIVINHKRINNMINCLTLIDLSGIYFLSILNNNYFKAI